MKGRNFIVEYPASLSVAMASVYITWQHHIIEMCSFRDYVRVTCHALCIIDCVMGCVRYWLCYGVEIFIVWRLMGFFIHLNISSASGISCLIWKSTVMMQRQGVTLTPHIVVKTHCVHRGTFMHVGMIRVLNYVHLCFHSYKPGTTN